MTRNTVETKRITSEELREQFPGKVPPGLAAHRDEFGAFLRGESMTHVAEPDWCRIDCDAALTLDREETSVDVGLWCASRGVKEGEHEDTDFALELAVTAFEQCHRLHLQAYRERRTPFWYTYDLHDAGRSRVHVRGGLGSDPRWRTRESLGGLPVRAAAECFSLAWAANGVDPREAEGGADLMWQTTVHVLDASRIEADGSLPPWLEPVRPAGLSYPPAFDERNEEAERELLKAYGLERLDSAGVSKVTVELNVEETSLLLDVARTALRLMIDRT